jgi:hypothetical protein
MSDFVPFAYGRHLVSGSSAWAAATEKWASDNECSDIDVEDTSEFFRIWLVCFMYGVCIASTVFIPYLLCSNRPDKSFDADQKGDGKVEFDLGDEDGASSAVVTPVAEEEESTAPNLEKAKAHLMRTSPLDARGRWRSVFGSKMSDVGTVGGIGIELYFRLLRSLGLCFAYLTMFSLPSLIFSSEGNFAPDVGAIGKTTVGNLGMVATGGVSQFERLVIVKCQGMQLVKLTKYFGWADFFGIITYMAFIAWYRFKFIPEAAIRDDEEHLTCNDYAVEVDFLPTTIPQQANYQDALTLHLSNMMSEARKADTFKSTKSEPRIREVSLVRDYDERLTFLKSIADLKKKQAIAEAHGKTATVNKYICCGKVPLSQKIEEHTQKASKKLGAVEELPVLRAYVIFDSKDDVHRMLTWYRFANFRIGRCCQSRALRFEGKAIRIREAPEPTNILWVNQDVSWKKRAVLKWVMLGIWLVVMTISLVAVYLTQDAARSLGNQASTQVVGEPSCDSGTQTEGTPCNVAEALEWTTSWVATFAKDSHENNCYCSARGYSEIAQSQELQDLCDDFIVKSAKTQGMSVCASLLVVAINAILQALIMVFAEKEKHVSVSSFNGSVMIKVAVSQFLNTSVIIFLLNYNGFGIFNGDYSDFERGWYAFVGSTLCMNMALNSVTPALVKVGKAIVGKVRRCTCVTRKMKHQAELMDAFENPAFDVALRYAQILTTCFCTLIYSPGLPILNFFALVYCFLNFWVDKWILLRFSKQPPAYDTRMPRDATGLLLCAGPLHMVVSIMMYSHPCTFPSLSLGGDIGGVATNAQGAAGSDTGTMGFSDRVTRESTWMSFAALIITMCFLCFIVVTKIMGATFGSTLSFCMTLCCHKKSKIAPDSPVDKDGEEITWDRAQPYIERTRPPASYRMENNREFAPLARLLTSDLADAAECMKSEKVVKALMRGSSSSAMESREPRDAAGQESSEPMGSAEESCGPRDAASAESSEPSPVG